MKVRLVIVMIIVFLFSATLAEAEGTLVQVTGTFGDRNPVIVDAIYENFFSGELSQVTVRPKSVSDDCVTRAIQELFQCNAGSVLMDECYFTCRPMPSNIVPPLASKLSSDIAFAWTDDVHLQERIEQCQRFLELLGIDSSPIPVAACYFVTKKGIPEPLDKAPEDGRDYYISISLSPLIHGMPLPEWPVSNRGESEVPLPVMTDMPEAEFVLNQDGQLVYMMVPTIEAAEVREMEGTPVVWESLAEQIPAMMHEALSNAMDGFMLEQYGIKDLDDFYAQYKVCITRIRAVWLDDWSNVLRPGWIVKVEILNQQTNEPLIYSDNAYYSTPVIGYYGFEAVTGVQD